MAADNGASPDLETPVRPTGGFATGLALDPASRAAVFADVAHEPGSAKPDPIVVADGIRRSFGGLTAVDVDHVEIQRGMITALIGPNGAGKTTFFNLMTGFDKPDEGTWSFSQRPEERRPLAEAELTDLNLRASWLQRAGAYLIDSVAVGVPAGLGVLLGLGFLAGDSSTAHTVGTVILVLTVLGALAITIINSVVNQGRTGQSWGKATAGIRLVGATSGAAPGVGTALVRQVLHVVDTAPLFLGLLWPLWDKQRQTFSDKITGTIVVSASAGETVRAEKGVAHALRGRSGSQVAQLGMVRTFQLTKVLAKLTVIENMRVGATKQGGERLAKSMFAFLWRDEENRNTARADDLLARFLLDAKREDFAGELSGGQRKLLEMARALMAEPELVMLDEPMAGVNPALKQSLLGHVKSLRDEGRSVLFVEHDMDMVRDISDWVIVMAQGQIIAEGPPDTVMGDQRVVDAYLGAHHDQELSFEAEEQIIAEAEAELANKQEDHRG